MKPLNVGDKVVCINEYQFGDWVGMEGVIVEIGFNSIGVDFGRSSPRERGHNLEGKLLTNTGWWFNKRLDDLKLVSRVDKQFKFDF